jgi:hypothetical protein
MKALKIFPPQYIVWSTEICTIALKTPVSLKNCTHLNDYLNMYAIVEKSFLDGISITSQKGN